jgi:hypothetical protein
LSGGRSYSGYRKLVYDRNMRLTLQFFAYGSLTDTTSSANTNDGESPGHRCCGGWRGLLALAWRHQRFDIRCPSACESVVIGAVLFIGAANAILLFNDK